MQLCGVEQGISGVNYASSWRSWRRSNKHPQKMWRSWKATAGIPFSILDFGGMFGDETSV
jgi:hypothetical protein